MREFQTMPITVLECDRKQFLSYDIIMLFSVDILYVETPSFIYLIYNMFIVQFLIS